MNNNHHDDSPVLMRMIGVDRDDCINKIYEKYGSNYALDGFTNIQKTGFLGFGKKEYVEQKFHLLNVNNNRSLSDNNYSFQNRGNDNSSRFNNLGGRSASYNGNQNAPAVENDFLREQAELLKRMDPQQNVQLSLVVKKIDQLQNQISDLSQIATPSGEHKTIEKICDLLDENGFTKSYRKKIADRIKKTFSVEDLNDFDAVQRKVVDWIGESISVKEDEYVRAPNVIIIVGPTGVGKTTTVAKMASKIAVAAKHNPNLKYLPVIRMVSTDTMRVAAVEQLSNYAEIIEAKVCSAETSDRLQEIYDEHAHDTDYFFIDTSGYSPNDYENIAKMRKILDVRNMKESVYLAVLAGISAKDLENILRNYEAFNFKSVIVTKCDETSTYGNLLSVLHEKGKSISFLTTGQDVINTIESASPLYFLKKLTGFKLDLIHLEEKFGRKD